MSVADPVRAHEAIGTAALHRFDWRDLLRWGLALALVLTVQGLGALVLLSWKTEPVASGAPPPAFMIELSQAVVAPQVEDIAAAPGELAMPLDATDAVEPIPTDAPLPEQAEPLETVPPEPVQRQMTEVAEAVSPGPIAGPVAEAVEPEEPTPAPPVDGAQPARPTDFEPEPVEEVIPDLVTAEAEVSVPVPMTVPAALARQRAEAAATAEQKREREEAASAKAAASRQTAPKKVEAKPGEQTAAAETTTTRRTLTVSPQQWQSRVLTHLDRAKRYPSEARRRREEGIPYLQFVVDRSGRVLSARIVRSSGFPALDQAALDMINRASPVPAPPDSVPDSRVTLTVPVNFSLR